MVSLIRSDRLISIFKTDAKSFRGHSDVEFTQPTLILLLTLRKTASEYSCVVVLSLRVFFFVMVV